jgi:hypothetical protein
LGLGVAELLARDQTETSGGLAAAYGLTLYNVLAACLILWTATELGGAALWSTGVIHAAIGALLVLALLRRRRA